VTSRSKIFKADALLLILAMIWGSGFIAQKLPMELIGPMTFVTIRLLLGALFLLPFLFIRSVPANPEFPGWRKLLPGLLGVIVVVFLGTWLQQVGLITTEAGTAGFITGLYVIFTPILGLFIGYRVRGLTWMATIIAVFGLFMLTVAGRPTINIGDLLILLSAIAWAAQILFVGWLAPKIDAILLTVIQLAGAGLLCLIITPFFEPLSLENILQCKGSLLYSGLIASGLAFLLQAAAQQDAPPAHAAILISLESVFAVLAGWLMLNEELTPLQFTGCGIMFFAIILAQIKPPRAAFGTTGSTIEGVDCSQKQPSDVQ
tara:strand:- start:4350 stop:5300 length:951 start_codon:yes stop_codon:yes gene_type:complete